MPDKLETLKTDLENYRAFWQADQEPAFQRYRDFVSTTEDCCERSHLSGHCTGSAFVTDPTGQRVLLLYHPFLKRWLQPGGHADGDPDLLEVARREAHEETGLALDSLHAVSLDGKNRIPFDLDIHPIPARASKSEPEHFHFDLRYLLTTDPTLALQSESEEMKLAWIELDNVGDYTDEESVLRMVRKLRGLSLSGTMNDNGT